MLETPAATRSPGLQPELVVRAKSLGYRAVALGQLLERLPFGSIPVLVQAQACVQLADLMAALERLEDVLGQDVDPQTGAAERSLSS